MNINAPVNEQLGLYAEYAIWIAAAVYAVAFILFTLDFAKTAAAVPERSSLVVSTAANIRAQQLVGAGAPASGPQGYGRAADAYASPTSHAEYADAEMGYESAGFRPQGRAAVAVMAIAALVHFFAVLARGFAAHRVPWGNMYEFCTTGAFVVSAVFLGVVSRKDLRFMGGFVTALIVFMLGIAGTAFPTPVGHLVPALQSYWLVIHVSIAVIASAVFTLTFCMSVMQLFQTGRTRSIEITGKDPMPVLAKVPSPVALENLAYRFNIVAFVLWTFTVMAGAVWAYAAWGRYWGWDTKEVWSFVIWVVYAAYLHARATRGWTGIRSAWLSIAGYLCILFNFGVVNVFFSGLHSYSGLK